MAASSHEIFFPKPGGTAITERAVLHCCFSSCAKLADIGCGNGESVIFIKKRFGCAITGVDIDRARIEALAGDDFICADAASLPFKDGELDGVLYECSLSKMNEPEMVLAEANRVLKNGGWIMISDFYARGEAAFFTGVLGRVERKESLFCKLQTAGFTPDLFEDRTEDMRCLWGQLILDHGEDDIYDRLGLDKKILQITRCGYALFVARKAER